MLGVSAKGHQFYLTVSRDFGAVLNVSDGHAGRTRLLTQKDLSTVVGSTAVRHYGAPPT